MSDQVLIRYLCFCLFKLFIFICGFSTKLKWLANLFIYMRSNGEIYRNKHFSSQKTTSSTLRFQGRCTSDIAILAWSVTWNYANSPFNYQKYRLLQLHLCFISLINILSSKKKHWIISLDRSLKSFKFLLKSHLLWMNK